MSAQQGVREGKRWRSCCSLALSSVCCYSNPQSGFITHQVRALLKRSLLSPPPWGVATDMHLVVNEQINALCNLRVDKLEKVSNEMLGYVSNTQGFAMESSRLWALCGPPVGNCCLPLSTLGNLSSSNHACNSLKGAWGVQCFFSSIFQTKWRIDCQAVTCSAFLYSYFSLSHWNFPLDTFPCVIMAASADDLEKVQGIKLQM